VQVSWNDDGSKLLTVRSAVVLNNKNTVPILVKAEAPGKESVTLPAIGKSLLLLTSFLNYIYRISSGPGKCAAVPLGYEKGRISIKPDELQYGWSDADAVELQGLANLEAFNKVEKHTMLLYYMRLTFGLQKPHIFRCPQEKDDSEIFRSVLHVSKTDNFSG
jgi:hypothetical protein